MKQKALFLTTLMALLLAVSLPLAAAPGGQGKGGGNQDKGNQDKGNQGGKSKGEQTRSGEKGAKNKTPADQLTANPKLADKLGALLPAGTDVLAASAGFRNLGQFVAAVHVSKNLGLSFDALKVEMVDNKLSLGQAILKLKPTVNATTEAQKAEREAENDLKKAGLPSK